MNLEAQFASRLAAADDEGFLTMAELYFALSRDHVGNPRADCHWRAQACADEARVRGLARIVPQMWKRASGFPRHGSGHRAMSEITDEQIRELLSEAGTAGDQEMHIIALIALEADSLLVLDAICTWIDDPGKRDELAGMLREQARAECARVIGDTLAMMGDG